MTDWFDPKTWESAAKTLATTLTALTKIRDRLATGKKHKLDQEVAALRVELSQLIAAMMKHIETQGMFVEGIVDSIRTLSRDGVETLARAQASTTEIEREHEERLNRIEREMRGLLSKAIEEARPRPGRRPSKPKRKRA